MKAHQKNNFDILRLILAVIVMLGHLPMQVSYLQPINLNEFLRGEIAVFFFFCISGFLITKSFIANPDLNDYFKKRALRIYPPIVAAFLLVFCTGLYFHLDKTFLATTTHLLLFQDLTPTKLPQIYSHGAFWTLVVEFQFYLILPLVVTCWKRKPWLTVAGLLMVYYSNYYLNSLGLIDTSVPSGLILRQNILFYSSFFISGFLLAAYFNKLRKYIPFLFLASLLVEKYMNLYYPVSIALLVVTIALIIPYLGKLCFFGDISYGVYLYHFPVIFIFSQLKGAGKLSTLTEQQGAWAIISAVIIISLASYHLLEKRCINLGRKKRITISGDDSLRAAAETVAP